MTANLHDPWAEALSATPPPPEVAGELLLDIWFCVLQKGAGKVPYDAGQHRQAERRTAITITIAPLPESGWRMPVERQFIAEFPKDGWLKVTLPSLRALGVTDLHALHKSWVKAELVEYDQYTASDGQTKTKSAPKILALYANETDCRNAWFAERGEETPPVSNGSAPRRTTDEINADLYGSPAPAVTPTANGNGNGNGNDAERRAAQMFLPALLKSCKKGNDGVDLAAVEQVLRENPLLAKHFTITSPDVIAAVQALAAEPAF
jgi:hypothetical protein